ncbi:MAG: Rrf2 family transcriptional regulator [Peptococcaceae bacterium BICA1-8]|nr:MAG: Rrf2 family transcriptional regulator [Peptococcaceae bacterium BICA1-8]
MKLSTKGRYGVKAMFDLAQNYGSGPIPLNTIARRNNISEHYLEQLIAVLRKAGLVKSVRGAQGGYILNKSPETITVGDIIRVLEGPIAPVDCVNEDEPEHCENADFCITRNIWAKVRDSVAQVLDSITLKDMLEESKNLQEQSYMYYI